MAKKKKIEAEEVISEVIQEEQKVKEVLTPSERRKYRRKVHADRRAVWLDEYWIITILSIVVLALMITLSIGKAVKDKMDAKKLAEEENEEVIEDEEEEDIFNIKKQMQSLL